MEEAEGLISASRTDNHLASCFSPKHLNPLTEGWQFARQKKGYTESETSLHWLRHAFNPQTKARANGKPLKLHIVGKLSSYLVGGSNIIGKQHFTLLYNRARREAFTPKNNRSGWSKAGLFLLDSERVLSDISRPLNTYFTTKECGLQCFLGMTSQCICRALM